MTTRVTSLSRSIITGAALIVILFGLKYASQVLSPIIFSIFIGILFYPVLRWLQQKGLPGWLALLIMIVGLLLLAALLFLFAFISLNDLTERLPFYQQRILQLANETNRQLQRLGIQVGTGVRVPTLGLEDVLHTLSAFLQSTLQGLIGSFLVILGIAFVMLEAQNISDKFHRGGPQVETALHIGERFSVASQQFFYLRAINNAIVAAGATIFLFAYGVDFALLWGVLIFFLSYIPNIGIVIACVPPVLLALIEHGLLGALLVIVVLFVINLIGDNIITPRLMGTGLNISPAVIFFSFLIWTWVFGIVGALLSVPLTVLLKLLLEANPQTAWLATLMSAPRKPDRQPAHKTPLPAPEA